jgi:hypothetical protein
MSGNPPYHNLTYYTFGTPNGLKPAIVLEELGLQYKAETVDITKNTQKEVPYLVSVLHDLLTRSRNGSSKLIQMAAFPH